MAGTAPHFKTSEHNLPQVLVEPSVYGRAKRPIALQTELSPWTSQYEL